MFPGSDAIGDALRKLFLVCSILFKLLCLCLKFISAGLDFFFTPIHFISSYLCLIIAERDFPGGPLVKTSPSNAGGVGSIPGQGAKIPHASQPKTKT